MFSLQNIFFSHNFSCNSFVPLVHAAHSCNFFRFQNILVIYKKHNYQYIKKHMHIILLNISQAERLTNPIILIFMNFNTLCSLSIT